MTLLGQLEAITDDYVDKNPVDIYFTSNVLLWLLTNGGKFQEGLVQPGELVDGGKKIRVILEYAASHAGSYGATTKIPQSKVDIYDAARFGWAGEYSANTIDLDDQVQNSGKEALVDLVFGKLRNIQKTIRDDMGTKVYGSNASDTKAICGLADLFSTNTSVAYGSLTEAEMPLWKANVITSATNQVVGLACLQDIRAAAMISQNQEGAPNLYITTQAIKDGYERTLHVQARYADVRMVNAGFANLLFDSNPIVADDKQSAGYVDGLNLRLMSLKTHSKYAFTKPKWEYSKDQPDTLTANVRWIGQLVTRNRKAHCRRTGVTVPT